MREFRLVSIIAGAILVAVAGACGESDSAGPGPTGTNLEIVTGDSQTVAAGGAGLPLRVLVTDANGAPMSGVPVTWKIVDGCGSLTPSQAISGNDGTASTTVKFSMLIGELKVEVALSNSPTTKVEFTASVTSNGTDGFDVIGGCNNVPNRFTSDLWVADGFAYTGTWGVRQVQGNAVYIWQLGPTGAPILQDSIITPGTGTISDIEVSPDGKWLVFTSENGGAAGIHAYELTAPGTPVFRAEVKGVNLHTGTLATIGGKLYAFAAKDPGSCALRIYDLSAAATGTITQASSTPIPDHYCIHDTSVRDGYAFVFAWDEGLYIYDVGNGSHGGSPTAPALISHTGSQASPKFGGQTHNGWWYWSPSGEKKYLFIGEEGPGSVGASSSGDIHVVDVSDFSHPVEVGSFKLPGAGTHNFWVDEDRQILYAAYYNGGVVALDISGTLSGNLSSRLIANIRPGGAGNTYVWGVMLYNGSLYASDMLTGLWQLSVP